MDRVFTIEQLRPIKNSMTISRDAKMGTTTGITFFSLGKDTSISQECYEQHQIRRSNETERLNFLWGRKYCKPWRCSAADGKFTNFTAIFPAHILPTCKGAVCCTPACFSFIERMKRGFLPAGGITFSLPPKLQITRDYLPAYRKYFSFHYLQNRKKENGRWFSKLFPFCSLIQEEKENAKDKHKKNSKSFQTYCFLPLKGHNYSFKLSTMFMLTASNIDKCNKGKNCNYNYVPLAWLRNTHNYTIDSHY